MPIGSSCHSGSDCLDGSHEFKSLKKMVNRGPIASSTDPIQYCIRQQATGFSKFCQTQLRLHVGLIVQKYKFH